MLRLEPNRLKIFDQQWWKIWWNFTKFFKVLGVHAGGQETPSLPPSTTLPSLNFSKLIQFIPLVFYNFVHVFSSSLKWFLHHFIPYLFYSMIKSNVFIGSLKEYSRLLLSCLKLRNFLHTYGHINFKSCNKNWKKKIKSILIIWVNKLTKTKIRPCFMGWNLFCSVFFFFSL